MLIKLRVKLRVVLPALFAEATQSQDFLVQYNHVHLLNLNYHIYLFSLSP